MKLSLIIAGRKGLCLTLLAPFALAFDGLALAAEYPRKIPNGFTWGELAILPEYCKHTQGTVWDVFGVGEARSPDLSKWMELIGEDFLHLHHYCYGLRNILRAQNIGEGTLQGKELLRRALNEFAFIFRACSPQMPLMPEVYLKQGEVQLVLGDILGAKESFERSRELKPSYWPAYSRWIDVLIGLRQYDSALQLSKEGLAHNPGEVELLNRLAKSEKLILDAGSRKAGSTRKNSQ